MEERIPIMRRYSESILFCWDLCIEYLLTFVISTGIPQVILPLWYDLYNYAQLVEYLGVGVWPGKDIAPAWNASIIGNGITSALDDGDLCDKAKSIAQRAKKYTGRAAAAEVISRMAMQAISS